MKLRATLMAIVVIVACRPKQAEPDADIYEFVNQTLTVVRQSRIEKKLM